MITATFFLHSSQIVSIYKNGQVKTNIKWSHLRSFADHFPNIKVKPNNTFTTISRILIIQILKACSASFKNGVLTTVEPRYPDTLQTRKKCCHKRSVVVTGVGETNAFLKLYF